MGMLSAGFPKAQMMVCGVLAAKYARRAELDGDQALGAAAAGK